MRVELEGIGGKGREGFGGKVERVRAEREEQKTREGGNFVSDRCGGNARFLHFTYFPFYLFIFLFL